MDYIIILIIFVAPALLFMGLRYIVTKVTEVTDLIDDIKINGVE